MANSYQKTSLGREWCRSSVEYYIRADTPQARFDEIWEHYHARQQRLARAILAGEYVDEYCSLDELNWMVERLEELAAERGA